ncbi:MAG: TerC family protein [Bdellovibrionaceae bacterium]|nr:TerC family protein [Pseudobdellovibrionaceae bacterium]
MDPNLFATFALLVGLEVVLGIDNILLISILTARIPAEHRERTRRLGLALALAGRCVLLLGASYIVRLSEPVLSGFSWKDLILIVGGGFLLFKAVKEIHHVVEVTLPDEGQTGARTTVSSVIAQIILLDVVFSIDSVITAVGLTDNLWVIYSAVLVSFALVLAFSGAIAAFVHRHPTLKILALSFLVTIGVTLTIEGFHGHVPKGYIYLPMGFALMVELLQMRFQHNQLKGRLKKENGGKS